MRIDGGPAVAADAAGTRRIGWLGWALAASIIAWIAAVATLTPLLFAPSTAVLVAVLLIISVRVFPPKGAPARGRWPLLSVLAAPWIVSFLLGPLGGVASRWVAGAAGWALLEQNALLAASAVLPVTLLPVMRGGRRLTAALGLLNACITLIVVATSELILAPGS